MGSMVVPRRSIAGLPTTTPGVPAPAAASVPPISPQMAAQRQAFMGMAPVPGFMLGKQGTINQGGAVGANADAIHALDSGAGHMI